MVSMRITTLDLGDSVTHVSTDWQIATNKLFTSDSIVCESKEDKINKTHIEFNDILDPTITYYGRTRELLSTGYTMWGAVDVFIPKDINDIEIDSDIPTKVGPPNIISSSSFSDHALSLFTLSVTGYSVVGTAKHTATTWIIEDLDSNIIWSSINDTFNKTNIHVNSVILNTNKVYRIRAVFHTSSVDSSQVATKTLVTKESRYIKLLTVLTLVKVSEPLELTINSLIGLNKVEWKIFSLVKNESTLVWEQITDQNELTTVSVPADTFFTKTRYMLMIKTNLEDNWGYFTFGTF